MLYTIVAKSITEIFRVLLYDIFYLSFRFLKRKNTDDYTLISLKTLLLITLNILKIMKNYGHINNLPAIDKFLKYLIYCAFKYYNILFNYTKDLQTLTLYVRNVRGTGTW